MSTLYLKNDIFSKKNSLKDTLKERQLKFSNH